MAIRQTVSISDVEEELMSKIGSLGLEVVFDSEDTINDKPKDEEETDDEDNE